MECECVRTGLGPFVSSLEFLGFFCFCFFHVVTK